MNFCSRCGKPVQLLVPEGDDRKRHVCSVCGHIHYQNPHIITGCLPRASDGRILLCRRAIEPRLGYWTLPSGFMENGETLEEGALRETWEEASARCRIVRMFVSFSLAHVSQIYFLFLADMESDTFSTTPESSEVALFREEEIPWNELAFRPVEFALRQYFDPAHAEYEGVHRGEFRRVPGDPWLLGS
ncbi:MAG: NUDIX hydrolase [Candidatus Eisenbacteria bacterium]|uniref:NUDIX hydrolase n=1 Tax=Eiseniibacteriota bacterium TaxID=2212470 RepID=A0A956SCZ2_UNCEI|nr:NUDIX hydrolase [Candidatus Eisenbacteria bacterium]MCB9464769.1 NUDIX hydrolase [Candidatus Eisenbacteria bacterium]